MDVLVVGRGGREHAIIWKLTQSRNIGTIYCSPGNAGIGELARLVPVKETDIPGIVAFAREKSLHMVVVAPDDPLAAGMVDALETAGIRAFGPTKAAACIESSKIFAKDLMRRYGIPSAAYSVYEDHAKALQYLEQAAYPLVIKADGLALGKGVVIATDKKEAAGAVKAMMQDRIFGTAGERILFEEFLHGPEVSVLAFTDGKTLVPMASSQDHKRAGDGDTGPNTGGMGAFSPSPLYTPEIAAYCMENIYLPTLRAMEREGRPFKGVLYFGLMLTPNGPRVLEYNARFGDPETQAVLPRLKTDLLQIFDAVIDGRLDQISIEWEDNAAVCIIAASGGYPGVYATGYAMEGLKEASKMKDINLFHAGTQIKDGRYVTAGGRVLGVTATGPDLSEAVKKAYAAIDRIRFKDMYFRKDIGTRK